MDERIAGIQELLPRCDLRTEVRLRARLRRLIDPKRAGRDRSRDLGRVLDLAESGARALAARERRRPRPRFDDDLPIAQHRDEIAGLVRAHQTVVVCGETGSGKSTQLPLICLEALRGVRGQIAHTQPRRIAARTIAQRLSEELDVPLGREVGYKVRFTDETSPDTFIKVLTDGMLLAELQSDRRLLRYDTIIIDEAHERSLNIDFLLGCLKRLLERRDDLRLVITSATIDPERFSRHFGEAPIVEVSGRTYPVEVRYRAGTDAAEADLSVELVDAIGELKAEGPGDILVFLPGEREIREAADDIAASAAGRGCEVVPLFARLPAKDQLRAFQAHERRRVILATNIAETSVTVPGVRYVIDTGLARISRYGSRSKVQGLPIEPVSRASADQRAGRCGRVAEGVCIRLYSQEDYDQRPEFTDPEIARSNLAGVVLQMKSLRLGAPETFPFVDRPSPRRLADGYDTLVELGALDARGDLTDIGRQLARLPVDPRLGRMLIAGDAEGSLREMLIITAALATRDPRERPIDRRDQADAAHKQLTDSGSDFLTLLKIWDAARSAERDRSGRGFRRWCQQSFLSWRALREWQDLHRQLRRLVTEIGLRRAREAAQPDAVHRAILSGLICNVGTRGERHAFEGTHGSEFYIHPASVVFGGKPKWIVAAEITRTTQLYARMIAPIQPAWIAELAPHLLAFTYSTPDWDDRTSAATVIERASLHGLRLPRKRRIAYGQQNALHAREMFIRHGLVEGRFRPQARFLERNDALIQRVRRMEAKARRRDVHAEAEARFDFFDRLLPEQVWSGKRFERWRHRAEKRDADVLCMTERDLLPRAEPAPTQDEYPDRVRIAGRARTLEYVHEPGQSDDGVMLRLPVAALTDLTESGYDWIVPGLVRERVIELIRGLSKPTRRGIGPAPQAADEFLESGPDQSTPLADTLATFLRSTRGVPVDAAALRGVAIPLHLTPKLVVVDDEGAPLAEGRDVLRLKREVGGEVTEVLRAAVDLPRGRGMRRWEIEDLPATVEVRGEESVVTAHAALADAGDSVEVRHFADAEEATSSHWLGVRRLLAIGARRDLARSMQGRAGLSGMRLAYSSLGRSASLDDELVLLTIDQVVSRAELVSTRGPRAFEALQVRVDRSLDDAFALVFEHTGRVLSLASRLAERLGQSHPAAWRSVADDLAEQLLHLLPDPPLSRSDPASRQHLPRYLEAAIRRWDKLSAGALERDARLALELSPRWGRWAALNEEVRSLPESAEVCLLAERYHRMLEEFRVSLFAQELGTATKVSGVRLDKLWAELRVAVRADARLAHLFAPGS